MSGVAAVVAASPADTRKLAQLRFIVTKPKQMLAVLVFNDGLVENRYISVAGPIDDNELLRVHNLLADVVEGRTLGSLRDLFVRRLDDDRVHIDQLRKRAFELGSQAVQEVERGSENLVLAGSARLLDLPEYADVDQLKNLMRVLGDRQHLVELLDKLIEAGVVTVYVGNETGDFGDADLSLVAAPYGGDDGGGTVGIIGPTRMDYARLMPLVGATAEAMTDALKNLK
jgi:heat-inducible transcriptional repressor